MIICVETYSGRFVHLTLTDNLIFLIYESKIYFLCNCFIYTI